jgi:hypothetical protein
MIEIEARQDEALRQLEELERQVERALAESVPLTNRLVPRGEIPDSNDTQVVAQFN